MCSHLQKYILKIGDHCILCKWELGFNVFTFSKSAGKYFKSFRVSGSGSVVFNVSTFWSSRSKKNKEIFYDFLLYYSNLIFPDLFDFLNHYSCLFCKEEALQKIPIKLLPEYLFSFQQYYFCFHWFYKPRSPAAFWASCSVTEILTPEN